jgi:N-acetylneuraminic acid mutarotase
VIGNKIYLLGTADYFRAPGAESEDFHSEAGRNGSPVGKALLVLDTSNLDAGWQRRADCPGLPQFDAGIAAAGGKIYRLGGIYAPLTPDPGEQPYYNAVDSWVYDPDSDLWSRLPDMPHGSNRRAVAFQDRYLILMAGGKYAKTWHEDGSRTQVYHTEEGQPFAYNFQKTVLVYDTKTGKLGTADPLIEPTAYPGATIVGDTIYTLGGEGGPRLWHPATLQIGEVSEIRQ